MLNCLKKLVLLGLLAATATAGAQGELVIRITEGVEAGVPIAIVPFGDTGAPAPQNIAEIIANDLRRSGRFAPLPMDNLPALPREAADVRFSDWRLLGTENLVIGKTEAQADGQYTIQFRLFDVVRGGQIAGFRFRAPANGLRRTAHQIADIIYEKLTGEPGAFNTRIAYITEGPSSQGGKLYSLKVADSDGYNPFTVLGSRQPMMSPAWSPDGNKLAYVAFDNRQAHIFVQDLASGTRQEVAAYPGINGAPAWSPDGTRLAVTLSKDGNAEIYVLDLNSRDLRRLTQSGAIDTEPAWAPDGESLVFTSDRGGKPQIYRIPASGGRAQRVTFEGEYNARATYSPDGNQLAMVHNSGGGFRIALLDLQSNGLRELTSSNLDESPSFAPNGSMILYATADSSGATLAAVSTDGSVKQRLAVEGSAVREPAWSPLRNK